MRIFDIVYVDWLTISDINFHKIEMFTIYFSMEMILKCKFQRLKTMDNWSIVWHA